MRKWMLIGMLSLVPASVWAAPKTHRPWFTKEPASQETVVIAEPVRKTPSRSRGFVKTAPRISHSSVRSRSTSRRTRTVSGRSSRSTSRDIVRETPAVIGTEKEATKAEQPSEAEIKDTPGDAVARQAMRYNGTDYKFGGKSKEKGFDCSGFVLRIFNDLKLGKLPHTSAALYDHGQSIRLSELRPGDLVFFRNTYKRGISHVGIYVGRNRFIHASNSRTGVIVTPLSDTYYQLRYAGARRLY